MGLLIFILSLLTPLLLFNIVHLSSLSASERCCWCRGQLSTLCCYRREFPFPLTTLFGFLDISHRPIEPPSFELSSLRYYIALSFPGRFIRGPIDKTQQTA
ncbi:uncharacterized protein GGS22DRAFT_112803 [Annulohypoxylon maeteangense]|uniref:uncharacterized protein n=1 Tax=Annulohypoxylon maeteangense TaxID=1927788 RepID=UPI00200871F6|nr:uncharacterized protein GGS22DRAFT_112803 [Annulohypoxylon maeteangense]KAI0887670.1 hypothetical protein GGS22DRAFT_112803 [Annulohypoxylon maeteangense]